MGFAIGGEEAAGIADGGLALAAGENAGGDLAFFDGKIAGPADGAGALFGGEGGGLFDEAVDAAIALLPGQGRGRGIFRLAVREGKRSFDGGAKRIFVDAIGGGAGGAAIDNGANGNGEAMLGDVLVDGVVGEARQSVGNFVDVDFGFFGAGGLGEAENGIDDAAQFALGEKFRGRAFFRKRLSSIWPAFIGSRMPCRCEHFGSARATRRGRCPWSAWAGLCRSWECPRESSGRACRWRRRNSRTPW